jgi:hypothetical protein
MVAREQLAAEAHGAEAGQRRIDLPRELERARDGASGSPPSRPSAAFAMSWRWSSPTSLPTLMTYVRMSIPERRFDRRERLRAPVRVGVGRRVAHRAGVRLTVGGQHQDRRRCADRRELVQTGSTALMASPVGVWSPGSCIRYSLAIAS